jgi:hypothetical protein
MTDMKNFANTLSEQMLKGKTPPPATLFDPVKYPYGVAPGGNKFGMTKCPCCGRPATETDRNDMPKAFMFRDESSAREYRISGMCQACQDSVFGTGD